MRLNLRIAALCVAALIAVPGFAQGSGVETYTGKCAPCHGADGLAAMPAGKALKAASFKTPALVKAPDAELMGAIENGKNKMPAWKGKLTDDQIKGVLAYIRTLQK